MSGEKLFGVRQFCDFCRGSITRIVEDSEDQAPDFFKGTHCEEHKHFEGYRECTDIDRKFQDAFRKKYE